MGSEMCIRDRSHAAMEFTRFSFVPIGWAFALAPAPPPRGRSTVVICMAVASTDAPPLSLWRGFLTSFLNPKGLFVYLSIVPQFIDPAGNVSAQAFGLSVTNAALCYVVYASVGLIAVHSSQLGTVSPLRTRLAEGVGGALLGGVALKLATD